jgi:hypothetical protein
MVDEIQKLILTRSMGYLHPEKLLCINPFYKASDDFISNNFDKAKEVYEHLYKEFCVTSVLMHGVQSLSELEKYRELE